MDSSFEAKNLHGGFLMIELFEFLEEFQPYCFYTGLGISLFYEPWIQHTQNYLPQVLY